MLPPAHELSISNQRDGGICSEIDRLQDIVCGNIIT
jgi:hypothetical protein